jgi:hypothetical protein
MYIPGWVLMLVLNAVFYLVAYIRDRSYNGSYDFSSAMGLIAATIASLVSWVIYLI